MIGGTNAVGGPGLPRFIEYQCRGCQYLVTTEPRTEHARYRECEHCVKAPDLQREFIDVRVDGLLWAYNATLVASAASDGAARPVFGGRGANAAAPASPAGSGGLPPTRKPARSEDTSVSSQRDAAQWVPAEDGD
ncbi:hypothetical protein [Halorarum halobium]|uniref:hypothetical protein n=1 Tax=Halorarum halobium TaxID=3075121 RepID=UPI0028ADC8CC|nr:hypothetical protein [Halobaculum sp. XH14]